MQDILTLKSSTPTDPPRRSSGPQKAVNEWWTEFGEIPGTARSGKLLDPERVETSGLIYLQQLRAKSVRPTLRFSAALPVYSPVMTPDSAPEATPEPVVGLPQPNALMPVIALAADRALGSASTWITALASVVLVVSLGLITWQTRKAAPAACPVDEAPPPAAARDSAPPAHAGPVSPAPLGPRPVAAAAPIAPVPSRDLAAAPVAPTPTRRARREHASDDDVILTAPTADMTGSKTSVYDALATLRPAAPAPVAASAPTPAPVASAAAREPQSAAELLQAAAAGKSSPRLVEQLPVTLPTARVLAKLRSRGGQVSSCLRQFGFLRDTINVRVTISGTTGRPASVQALGQFAGTPAGKCVERSFGGLSLGRFQSASQSVSLPFVVR